MRSFRLIVREWAVYLAFFLWFFAIFGLLTYWPYHDMALVYRYGLLLLPFFLFWLVRRYCKNIFLFFILHIILLAVSWGVPLLLSSEALLRAYGSIYVNFFFVYGTIFAFILTLHSVVLRFTLGRREPVFDDGTAIFFLATMAFFCILSERNQYDKMTGLLTLMTVLILALRLLYGHLYSVDFTMDIAQQFSKQPVSAIRAFNNKLILFFILLLGLSAAAAHYFNLSGGVLALLLWLGEGLRLVLRFILGVLFRGGEPPEATYIPEDTPLVEETPFMMDVADRPTPLILLILEKLLVYAGFAVAVAAVLFGLGYGCYRLYKYFYGNLRKTETGDTQESVLPDYIEMVKVRFGFADTEPVNRVRRLFYRKVRRYIRRKGSALAVSDTPWEMAEKIKASEDIDALTERYMQARYDR